MQTNMKFKLSFLFIFLSASLFAQQNKFIGIWEGKINAGVSLRIVFNFMQDSRGDFYSTMKSPDQSPVELKADRTFLNNDSVFTEIEKFKVSFSGKLINDSTIDGTFTQGVDIPLKLKKVEKISDALPKTEKPQTPKPPFNYKSEVVQYSNADKSISFGGTVTIPNGNGPFPAILLITGSGAQNRDEEILGHKPFAVLADFLTKKGFIVLRVDDRGVGKTTGDANNATSVDFAKDVNTSLDYLKARKETDVKKIGLMGHSEGGMIAPMVATQRNDINFIVLLAGPGVKIIDLMTGQNIAFLNSAGISKKAQYAYGGLYKRLATAIAFEKDSISGNHSTNKIINNWLKKTDTTLLRELSLTSKEQQHNQFAAFSKIMRLPWFKYFLSYNPEPALKKLKCKVLALNGDKDIQVISKQNLSGIRRALLKSKSPKYDVMEMPGLNHLFQTCKTCTVQEYGELEETFSPKALEVIGDWLIRNVK